MNVPSEQTQAFLLLQLARVKSLGSDAQKELNNYWLSGNGQSLCQALVHHYFPLTVRSSPCRKLGCHIKACQITSQQAKMLLQSLQKATTETDEMFRRPEFTSQLQITAKYNSVKGT